MLGFQHRGDELSLRLMEHRVHRAFVQWKAFLTSGLERMTRHQIPIGNPIRQHGEMHGIIAIILAATARPWFSRFFILMPPSKIKPLMKKPMMLKMIEATPANMGGKPSVCLAASEEKNTLMTIESTWRTKPKMATTIKPIAGA